MLFQPRGDSRLPPVPGVLPGEFSQHPDHDDHGHRQGDPVGHRGREQGAQDPRIPHQGEEENHGHTEDEIPQQGEGHGQDRLAQGLQEDADGLVDAAQKDGGQVDAEGQGGKLVVQVALTAEQGDDLHRKELEGHGCRSADDHLGDHHGLEDLLHPPVVARLVVVAHNGLAPGGNAHHDRR